MPLRPLPFREVKRKLEAAGFVQVGQKGSHVKFAKATDQGLITTTYRTTVKSLQARSAVSFAKLA